MTLVKATIKAEIIAITNELNSGDVTKKDPVATVDTFADKLSDVIINAIKSSTITIPVGTIITAGSATTQTQSVPGIVNNGIT
jgi:hypothetical protein